ncbi:hypothetical protein MTO96_019167 [Rhipicephalus appendiculatus]
MRISEQRRRNDHVYVTESYVHPSAGRRLGRRVSRLDALLYKGPLRKRTTEGKQPAEAATEEEEYGQDDDAVRRPSRTLCLGPSRHFATFFAAPASARASLYFDAARSAELFAVFPDRENKWPFFAARYDSPFPPAELRPLVHSGG